MGLFWDLMQQNEIQKQSDTTKSLEQRITFLERELTQTKSVLNKTLVALEKHLGKDIDGDGKMG